MTAVIETQQLRKVYRTGSESVAALAGVDLVIDQGEYVAIMGASGSGKSTLMNILGCLDQPSSGVYRLGGTEVQSLGDAELAAIRNRRIGFVFQSFHLLPRMDAALNVELPLLYRGDSRPVRRERARKALERVNLTDRAHHRPNELSGGQCQRVAIARAIVTEPALLLADEPTGNLDSRTAAEIMDLFAGLHQTGTTVILVTHDPEVAGHAHRRVRLHDGRVVSDERGPGTARG